MSKPNKARFNLGQLRQAHADKSGGDVIEFEHEDGNLYRIPAPGFWPDDVKTALKAGDDITAAQLLMGDTYAQFKAAGGRADDVMIVIAAYADAQGVALGE